MQYPKPFMRISELTRLGISKQMLLNAYREKGQRFAQKISPEKKKSAIVFETAEFEKWRMKQLEMENKSLPRGIF